MITTPTQLSPTQMTFHCRPLILVYRVCKSTPPPPRTHTHTHTSLFSRTYPHSPTRTQPLIHPSVPTHPFLSTICPATHSTTNTHSILIDQSIRFLLVPLQSRRSRCHHTAVSHPPHAPTLRLFRSLRLCFTPRTTRTLPGRTSETCLVTRCFCASLVLVRGAEERSTRKCRCGT
jgi:hypothetical protein